LSVSIYLRRYFGYACLDAECAAEEATEAYKCVKTHIGNIYHDHNVWGRCVADFGKEVTARYQSVAKRSEGLCQPRARYEVLTASQNRWCVQENLPGQKASPPWRVVGVLRSLLVKGDARARDSLTPATPSGKIKELHPL
jgi:hypothetical protein